MFEISDACYAVENAVEELKAAADGVIGSNENDGVAKWLLEDSSVVSASILFVPYAPQYLF